MVVPSKEKKEKTVFLAIQARDNAPHYQHSEVGYNYRMSNISAGIGRGQMQVLDEHISLRREMHQFYSKLFNQIPGVTLLSEPNSDFYSNHWLSAILIDPKKSGGITREDLRLAFEEENIESRPLWKPMHLQPLYQEYPFYGTGVCERLFENGLCLPSGSNLTDSDRSRIEEVVDKLFK